jgi:hypothetical protein
MLSTADWCGGDCCINLCDLQWDHVRSGLRCDFEQLINECHLADNTCLFVVDVAAFDGSDCLDNG